MAPGSPLSADMQEAFLAAKEGTREGTQKFEQAIARTNDPDDLDLLSKELLDAQERKELSISLAIRDALRLRIDQLHQAGVDLAVLNAKVHLNALRDQTMFHDIRASAEPYAKKAGEVIAGGIEKLTGSKNFAGQVARDMKPLLGRTKNEVSKNVSKHALESMMHALWTRLAAGNEKAFLVGKLVRYAKDRLQQESAETTIAEAIELERQADSEKKPEDRQTNIVFKGMDKYVWEKMSPQERQSTDWKAKVHQVVDSIRKADRTLGTKPDKPIIVTLAALQNVEKEQKAAEAKKADERTVAMKRSWGLDDKTVVKYEGDKVRARVDGGTWTVTMPNATHLTDAGDASTPEARALRSAIKQGIPGLQEIEIGGSAWEFRKADTGSGLRLTLSAGSEPLLPSLATLAPQVNGFVRAKAFKIDQTLPTTPAMVEYSTDNGLGVLKWNGVGEIDRLPQLFTDVAAELQTKPAPSRWKFESTTNTWMSA